jgi:hypothetical protein
MNLLMMQFNFCRQCFIPKTGLFKFLFCSNGVQLMLLLVLSLKEVLSELLGNNSSEERDTFIKIWEARKT